MIIALLRKTFLKKHKPIAEKETRWNVSCSVEKPMPLIKKQGYLKGPRCERILVKLEILQDNGHFDEHEHLVTSLLQRWANGNKPHLPLALKIEDRKDRNKTCHVLNSNILMAIAYVLLVADIRKRKRQLFEYLERSEFLFQNYDSPEDWAELYQKYGRLWLDRMSLIPDDQQNEPAGITARENTRYYFEQDISYSQKDHRVRVKVKRKTYIHLSLTTLLLDCVSTAARTQAKAVPLSDKRSWRTPQFHSAWSWWHPRRHKSAALEKKIGSVLSPRTSATYKGVSWGGSSSRVLQQI